MLIACRISTGNIIVDVKDTGPGVCSSLEGRLFQHFATTKVNGHGLGLPVVKELLEDAAGKVVYERQDKWTVFTVSIFGGEPKAKKQMTPTSMVEAKKTNFVRIVVIDDCVFTRLSESQQLVFLSLRRVVDDRIGQFRLAFLRY